MQKAIIIGCPGAGKSTFARKLRDSTGLPLYYLDLLWHKPDKTNLSEKEFDDTLDKIVRRKRWIIDGNYQRTLETRFKKCDTIFLLDYPVSVCLEGAKSRIGKKREDMPWVESELDEEFKQWILQFSANQLPKIYQLLEKYRTTKNIYVFQSRKDSETYLKQFCTRTTL